MSLKHNLTAALVGGASSATEGTASIKDDLYLGVNGDWLNKAKIPSDQPTTGGFADLQMNVEKTLMHDFNEMAAGKVEPNNVLIANFIAYYKLATDFKTRNEAGFKPIQNILDEVQAISSFEDLQKALLHLIQENVDSIFPVSVEKDMKDTEHYVLTMNAPGLFLPDTTYYSPENEQGPQLIQLLKQSMIQLFKMAGFSDEHTEDILNEAIKFDAEIAKHKKSSEEMADYPSLYNPESLADFSKHSEVLDLRAYVDELTNGKATKVIVSDTKYYDGLNSFLTLDNLGEVKSWMLVGALYNWAKYLSEDARLVGGKYEQVLMGIDEAKKPERAAFLIAYDQFNMVVGDYYARKYFGSKAKADVMNMAQQMIEIYKSRLAHNDWLSAKTKEQAIIKLNTIIPNVGFPDKIDSVYAKYVVTPAEAGGTFIGNTLRLREIELQNQFEKIGEKVDRTMWEDQDPATVNAYYDPSANIIVFPAAILQAPFYSLKQSISENFGGIGAVMAHEISHAFDNNGAQFDENGNMNNWWTEADLKHFQDLTQAMIKEFDGIAFAGSTVNGTQIVSENVADQGGLSCALEAAKGSTNFSSQEFFKNWAKIWCSKDKLEFAQFILATDVHAPSKLRANVQAQNIDDFYTTFDVHEGDGMWLAPEKRVHIW